MVVKFFIDQFFKNKKTCHEGRSFKEYMDYSRNLTVTPERTLFPKSFASQFVKRIQPCDAVLEIKDGFGVP